MFRKCIFISAEILDSSFNPVRSDILEKMLKEFSFNYKQVEGCYKGAEEKSFCVETDFNIADIRLLRKFARVFDQESILLVNNGDASLYYLQSQKTDEIGLFQSVNPKSLEQLESYSIIDNKLYTIL